MKITITDLTRFSNPEIVCIAGLDIKTGECIRPLPYIETKKCEELNILPGNIIEGNFTRVNAEKPHTEDYNYDSLKRVGICGSDEFEEILKKDLVDTISNGFGYGFVEKGKVIPKEFAPNRSIITIKLSTSSIEIVKDRFKEGKIRLNLLDNDSRKYSYLSITDLGFYNYAMKHYHDSDFPNLINNFIREQQNAYLRIGLGREFQDGFWLQVNGIYTFPNYDKSVRSYK